jgi:acetyl-CoA/propionyl-CoA carboxylase biotin carboxyl carrier protein
MKSLLIANRGEIAVRIIRTAQEMGVRTIAVYSELDRDALHVEIADEAWNIGPPPAAESYLNSARILQVARASKAEAIHPGYGFLSENAKFARDVLAASLIWVGPPPDAIEAMGDKITSRRSAQAAGVPTVPGTTEPLTNVAEVAALAKEYGFPVAIKAAHGGGGKGMRVVDSHDDVDAASREPDARQTHISAAPRSTSRNTFPDRDTSRRRFYSTRTATVFSSASGIARCNGVIRS